MKHSISKINVILILTIAIIVVAGFVSCSNREVTGDGNYSQTGGGGIVETPTTPSQPKPDDIPIYNPTKPVLEIKSDWGAIQFKGLTFKNENHTISIVIADNGCARFKLNDKIYDFGSRIYNSQYNPNTFIFGNINGNINDRGYAEFRETGDLLIWFNNNQSDLIRLKLVQKGEVNEEISDGTYIPEEYAGVYFDILRYHPANFSRIHTHTSNTHNIARFVTYQGYSYSYYNAYETNYLGNNSWKLSGYTLELLRNEKGQRIINWISIHNNIRYTNTYIHRNDAPEIKELWPEMVDFWTGEIIK